MRRYSCTEYPCATGGESGAVAGPGVLVGWSEESEMRNGEIYLGCEFK